MNEDWSDAEPVVLLAEVRSCNGTTLAGGHLAHSRRCPVHGEPTYELAALCEVGWLDPTAAEVLRAEHDALLLVAEAAKAWVSFWRDRHMNRLDGPRTTALIAAVDEWQKAVTGG